MGDEGEGWSVEGYGEDAMGKVVAGTLHVACSLRADISYRSAWLTSMPSIVSLLLYHVLIK